MPIKPTPAEAIARLRLDDSLGDDLNDAIEQAHAQAVQFLDGQLYADKAALDAAADLRGVICTPDILAAQLLLVDVLVGNNTLQDREAKEAAALRMLRPHRNMGA